jgi:cbb3-type cytochrome c oxidase subunit III
MNKNARMIMGLAAGVMLAAGCASTGKLAKEQAGYPREKVDARALFVENCARCHGADGRAKTFHGVMLEAQNFTDAGWRVGTADAEIIHAIKTGPRSMPAFEGKLSEAEIEALAAYVKTFAQPHP